MKKAFFFIFLQIISLLSIGQSLNAIKKLLQEKDYTAFGKCIDSTSRKYSKVDTTTNIRAIWGIKRDLIGDFQEATVDVYEFFPDPKVSNISSVESYRIELISIQDKIVHYNFSKKVSNGPSWDDFKLKVLDSFRNKQMIDSLNNYFFRSYGTSINRADLFDQSNEYGFSCTKGNMPQEMRMELNLILSKKNYGILNSWLKSANAEKQVYAVDGLYQLKKKGYKLNNEEKGIIDLIKSKKGKINTCRGCTSGNTDIIIVINEIAASIKAQ